MKTETNIKLLAFIKQLNNETKQYEQIEDENKIQIKVIQFLCENNLQIKEKIKEEIIYGFYTIIKSLVKKRKLPRFLQQKDLIFESFSTFLEILSKYNLELIDKKTNKLLSFKTFAITKINDHLSKFIRISFGIKTNEHSKEKVAEQKQKNEFLKADDKMLEFYNNLRTNTRMASKARFNEFIQLCYNVLTLKESKMLFLANGIDLKDYGNYDCIPLKQREIAIQFKCSQQNVDKIIQNATKKLKTASNKYQQFQDLLMQHLPKTENAMPEIEKLNLEPFQYFFNQTRNANAKHQTKQLLTRDEYQILELTFFPQYDRTHSEFVYFTEADISKILYCKTEEIKLQKQSAIKKLKKTIFLNCCLVK